MLGSVAKGTALRTVNDFDVTVYVRRGEAPGDDAELVPWVVERLREAYGALIDPEQVQAGPQCATITFRAWAPWWTSCPCFTKASQTTAGTWYPKTLANAC